MTYWEHITYLSDGTTLSEAQSDELRRTGKLKLSDGRVLLKPENFDSDYLYVEQISSQFLPIKEN